MLMTESDGTRAELYHCCGQIGMMLQRQAIIPDKQASLAVSAFVFGGGAARGEAGRGPELNRGPEWPGESPAQHR